MVAFLDKLEVNVIPGHNLTAITAKNVSKEDAIKFCVKHYNLELKNIAVIGNSKNDKGMFMLPEVFSITYTEAKPYLKQIASLVIDEPKSEFIAQGLVEFEKHINNLKKDK
ncbi:HAD hydrolase family protein [bacterium]|nr:HAD hydrolase family protein [bacterium]